MRYLLDTNACIAAINPEPSPVKVRLARYTPNEVTLCAVVPAELLWGAWRSSRREANLALLRSFFARFESLPFDDAAAESYGPLRADLARRGTPIGPNDLMIAAIALANNLVLVTHNAREFIRVDGLQLEDWS